MRFFSSKQCRAFLGLVLILGASSAFATPREKAYRLYNRLNGVPPSAAKLNELEAMIVAGQVQNAAMHAINDPAGHFYDLTLKSLAARWSNAESTPRVELNDFVATVIGIVRDNVPFSEILSADILYIGNVPGAPAYSLANNDHYAALAASSTPLVTTLQRVSQSTVSGLPTAGVAGLLSTRAFGEAYYKAGTNRRAVAFTLENFLCHKMEQLSDTTRSDFRVRRDIPRAPGGDSALYRNKCAGCHVSLDSFGGAFAFYDWDDNTQTLTYSPGVVRPKFNRNATEFLNGFISVDDSWINNIQEGQNKSLGWHGEGQGQGAATLGKTLAQSDAFASCMATHVFRTVCLRSPSSSSDENLIAKLSGDFVKQQFNMKHLFAQTAVGCLE